MIIAVFIFIRVRNAERNQSRLTILNELSMSCISVEEFMQHNYPKRNFFRSHAVCQISIVRARRRAGE